MIISKQSISDNHQKVGAKSSRTPSRSNTGHRRSPFGQAGADHTMLSCELRMAYGWLLVGRKHYLLII